MIAEDIKFITPRNSYTDVIKDISRYWLDTVTYSKSVSSIPDEGSGELSEEKLTGDNC